MDVKKECKYCGNILSNENRLQTHLTTSSKCLNYQGMIILCKDCNFQTEYFNEFLKHKKNAINLVE